MAFGRPKGKRGSYRQWEEAGVPLTVVFEILPPGNTVTEMDRKYIFYEEYGVEDPRVTLIDGLHYITYVSVSRWGITTSLATTKDFHSFERRGVIFLPDHKDVVIFPERIAGQYVALTRPMPQSFSRIFGVWIAFSEDLVEWGGHETVCLPRWERWDELRISWPTRRLPHIGQAARG